MVDIGISFNRRVREMETTRREERDKLIRDVGENVGLLNRDICVFCCLGAKYSLC